jgi:cytochrome P450
MSPTEPARTPLVPVELDKAFLSEGYLSDPYPIYERVRSVAPIGWSGAFQSWVLTRYDDVLWALREPRLTTSGRMRRFLQQLSQDERARADVIEKHYETTLPFLGPPRHTVVKSLIQKSFSVAMVERLRPSIQQLVDRYLDEADNGEFDIMVQLAHQLPVQVIGTMLGVPESDRGQFRPWTNHIFAIFSSGHAVADRVETGRANLLEMRAYLHGLIEERRRRPQDDLISELVRVSEAGETLTEDEVLANCVTLYTAGHETTSGLIGNAFLALLRHPDQLRLLREHPELIGPAVEECLRYDTSVQRAWRLAAEDIDVGGITIPKGDIVSPMVAAANRDPHRFPDPNTFDISRKSNRQVAFGQGIHFCVGAGLARLETSLAITTFLRRFSEVHHSDDSVVWGTDMTFRSLRSLPVSVR